MKVNMLPLLVLIATLTSVFAQSELDYYIERFRYKALKLPSKNHALYALGEKLFKDENLSGKRNISCQSCHSAEGFSGDSLPLGVGEGSVGFGPRRFQSGGSILARHTQNIYNVGHPEIRNHFWDGRVEKTFDGHWRTPEPKFNGSNPELKAVAETFENVTAVQSIFPFTDPKEMLGRGSKLSRLEAWDFVLGRIFDDKNKDTYRILFQRAFPDIKSYNIAHVGNALSHFMKFKFSAVNTPWDMYLRGRKDALSERMRKGAVLFHSKAGCFRCHNGDHFSNFTFHNVGIPQIGADDKGRASYAFRVPALRNVGVTTPFMHSGVFKTLPEVVNHYNDPVSSLRNFSWNPRHPHYRDSLPLDTDSVRNDNREGSLSPMLARNLELTPEEKDDLVCFLAVALTDVSLHRIIKNKGVVNEISDCSPLTR